MKKTWQVKTAEGWDMVAHDVAMVLQPGDILALHGPLGAGKTTFVQALARALGASRVPKSPTFSMLRAYTVRQGSIRRLLHMDAYRIDDERDIAVLDLDEEISHGDAILAVEWPEQVKRWIAVRHPKQLRISIKKDGREASFSA